MTLAPPPPQAVVIFGASGDLTRRKIMPALYNLFCEHLLPDPVVIVGYARSDLSEDEFRAHAREGIKEFSRIPLDDATWTSFEKTLHYVAGEFSEPHCFSHLVKELDHLNAEFSLSGRRLYYCATPPSAFAQIVQRLGEAGNPGDPAIVFEKPFGRDRASARELNDIVHSVFDESRVFRIDHYLGKETVQNILMFRFANSMFERVWHRDAIDHVQITVAEDIGVGSRGGYYEEAGAIRDIVQNHLLQLAAFIGMEPPRSLEAEAIRDEKVKLLSSLRAFRPEDVVRGQYDGYRDEEGVAADSTTETYAAVQVRIDNWRWAGVPFFLRTGKRLPRRDTEVTIRLREAPRYLFDQAGIECATADHISVRIQPDEGITFAFNAKEPGADLRLKIVRMDFDYAESFDRPPAEAYERLLHEAMERDGTLFIREDEVDRSWEIVQAVLDGPPEVFTYPAGSWGPKEAERLIAPRHWHLH